VPNGVDDPKALRAVTPRYHQRGSKGARPILRWDPPTVTANSRVRSDDRRGAYEDSAEAIGSHAIFGGGATVFSWSRPTSRSGA